MQAAHTLVGTPVCFFRTFVNAIMRKSSSSWELKIMTVHSRSPLSRAPLPQTRPPTLSLAVGQEKGSMNQGRESTRMPLMRSSTEATGDREEAIVQYTSHSVAEIHRAQVQDRAFPANQQISISACACNVCPRCARFQFPPFFGLIRPGSA